MNKIIIGALVIAFLCLFINRVERFEDQNINLMGHEEGMPNEYRKITYNTNKCLWQHHKFKGEQWHTRFPYMVDQRYSYDDVPNGKENTSFYDYAHLKELPVEMHNVFYGKVPKEVSQASLEYYPDTSNQKYKNKPKIHYSYPPYNKYGYPYITDTNYRILPLKNDFVGFDYDKMNDSTTNAGEGTSDYYYFIDRINNNQY